MQRNFTKLGSNHFYRSATKGKVRQGAHACEHKGKVLDRPKKRILTVL